MRIHLPQASTDGRRMRPAVPVVTLLALAAALGAGARERGVVNPPPLPPLVNPADPTVPAKELFARKLEPAHLAA